MSVEQTDNGIEAVDDVEEQVEQEVEAEPEGEAETAAAEAGEGDDDGEIEAVSFGEPKKEPEAEAAPAWVKELRKKNRELEREARAAKAELAKLTAPQKPKLGPKPTLESVEYDADAFATALEGWHQQKAKVEAAEAEERKAQEAHAAEWGQTVQKYREAKQAFKVPDFDEAEAAVEHSLDVVQQSIIMTVADRPEALIYALGKDDALLAELSQIKDAVKFTARVAKLETRLTVTKKTPPKPARTVNGTAPSSGVTDNTLARLEAEADKTGDRTKVLAYRRQQRLKGK